jgi:hypothetical protein
MVKTFLDRVFEKHHGGSDSFFETEKDGLDQEVPYGFMHFFKPEYIKNPGRKWYQLWKPRMILKDNSESNRRVDDGRIKS